MNWFEKVLKGIKDFLTWLGSEETQEQAVSILRTALLIASMLDKFNAPLSNREKPYAGRIIFDFLRYMNPAEKHAFIGYLKETDFSKVESHEIDKILGDAIAAHVAKKNPLTLLSSQKY